MLVYFVIFLLLFIWYELSKRYVVNQKQFLPLNMLILFVISIFRDEQMGADYKTYISYFNVISRTGEAYFEKGYVLYNYIISKITTDYWILGFSVSIMLFIPLYILIKKYVESKYWPLVVMIFALHPYLYIQTTFNMMRQCCAEGIVLCAVIIFCANNKRIIKFIAYSALVMLAWTFHRSAIICLIIPFISRFNWNSNKWRICAVGSFVMGVFVKTSSITNLLFRLFGYEGHASDGASLLSNPLYQILVIVYVFWLCNQYDYITDELLDDRRKKFFVDIYMFTMCFLLMAVNNDSLYRVRLYFLYASLPAIAILFDAAKARKSMVESTSVFNYDILVPKLYVFYTIGFYFSYFLYLGYTDSISYVPFKFLFW